MHALRGDIARDGYAFVRSYRPEADVLVVARALGQPLDPLGRGAIQELIPRSNSTPNTYSGSYGLGSFPFHTDLAHWRTPPRYLLLRCVTGYADVPTLLLDGQDVFDAVPVDILARAIFKPRRPRNGALELLRLYEPTDNGYCFRWDDLFLRPASRVGDVADRRIKEQLSRSEPLRIALAHAGDTLLWTGQTSVDIHEPLCA